MRRLLLTALFLLVVEVEKRRLPALWERRPVGSAKRLLQLAELPVAEPHARIRLRGGPHRIAEFDDTPLDFALALVTRR